MAQMLAVLVVDQAVKVAALLVELVDLELAEQAETVVLEIVHQVVLLLVMAQVVEVLELAMLHKQVAQVLLV
jgi:hypothetical protein